MFSSEDNSHDDSIFSSFSSENSNVWVSILIVFNKLIKVETEEESMDFEFTEKIYNTKEFLNFDNDGIQFPFDFD